MAARGKAARGKRAGGPEMIRSRGIRFGQAGGQAVFGAFHDAGPSCFPNISDKTVVTFRKGW